MRILIVEDDALLGDGIASGLRSLGFAVDWFQRPDEADRALESAPYDAIVLDLGLPGRDGLDCLARWRGRGHGVPVLILTAREALDSRIAGLDAGADDYLVKPVALEELAARLRAVTRRSQGRPESVWKHGPLEYRPAGRAATWQGEPVDLTAREAMLLELFLANPGRVLSRQQIHDKLYGWGEELESNALEVYVHHLRRKFSPRIVRTVRGVGYALGSTDAAEPAP
ncbi:MAG TPA: response regulator [Casimicrobiaceae bacterium]|nr:response regulator [Casimicrobiaceae bacterium]